MDKEPLREEMRLLRQQLSDSIIAEKSDTICQRLLSEVEWSGVKSLHCYVPMNKLKEVSTWPVLHYVWQHYPSIITAVPTARRRGKFEAVRVGPATRWRGLLPASRVRMEPDFQFDLVIVPTLAFDKRGFRLGWGGGFYDRFLAAQTTAQKIGICFASGQVPRLPNEPHDIALDKIITERGIISKS